MNLSSAFIILIHLNLIAYLRAIPPSHVDLDKIDEAPLVDNDDIELRKATTTSPASRSRLPISRPTNGVTVFDYHLNPTEEKYLRELLAKSDPHFKELLENGDDSDSDRSNTLQNIMDGLDFFNKQRILTDVFQDLASRNWERDLKPSNTNLGDRYIQDLMNIRPEAKNINPRPANRRPPTKSLHFEEDLYNLKNIKSANKIFDDNGNLRSKLKNLISHLNKLLDIGIKIQKSPKKHPQPMQPLRLNQFYYPKRFNVIPQGSSFPLKKVHFSRHNKVNVWIICKPGDHSLDEDTLNLEEILKSYRNKIMNALKNFQMRKKLKPNNEDDDFWDDEYKWRFGNGQSDSGAKAHTYTFKTKKHYKSSYKHYSKKHSKSSSKHSSHDLKVGSAMAHDHFQNMTLIRKRRQMEASGDQKSYDDHSVSSNRNMIVENQESINQQFNIVLQVDDLSKIIELYQKLKKHGLSLKKLGQLSKFKVPMGNLKNHLVLINRNNDSGNDGERKDFE